MTTKNLASKSSVTLRRARSMTAELITRGYAARILRDARRTKNVERWKQDGESKVRYTFKTGGSLVVWSPCVSASPPVVNDTRNAAESDSLLDIL